MTTDQINSRNAALADNANYEMLSEQGKRGESYQHEVKLTSAHRDETVVFRHSPEIEESAQALYYSKDDLFATSSFLYWIGSPSRSFNISAKLISRTAEEADESWKYLNFLKAWRMPRNNDGGFAVPLSADTPDTLRLFGYMPSMQIGHFLGIPVVITNLNITMPIDVDYIRTSKGVEMPIIMPVTITLKESHTLDDLAKFDYNDYLYGTLREWS